MLKILYIPTGNVFTMPDEEAIKLANSERFNYKILDAGIQEEKEPEKVSEEDISKLVLQAEERAEEIEKEDKEEVQESYNTELDFDKFTKADLVGAVRAAGLKVDAKRTTKAKLIEMAINAGIKP